MNLLEASFYLLNRLLRIYEKGEAEKITDMLLEHLTGSDKTERMLYKNAALSPMEEETLKQNTERLLKHEPVQYVLGEAWFYGMKFQVDKNVLIPRPETEELVDWILKDRKTESTQFSAPGSILDIGTGSGCIAIALKKKIPGAQVTAIDVCSEALFKASENALALEATVDFKLLDFLDEEKWNGLGQYDVIVSNPPYVRQSEAATMHKRVTGFEPHQALFVPDSDALIFYRKLAAFAKKHLKSDASIFVEINESFGGEVIHLFSSEGFSKVELRKDMQGKDRMLKAELSVVSR
jgi:release factor glutamine methyltransferase